VATGGKWDDAEGGSSEQLELEQLSDFHTRWFSGAAG